MNAAIYLLAALAVGFGGAIVLLRTTRDSWDEVDLRFAVARVVSFRLHASDADED